MDQNEKYDLETIEVMRHALLRGGNSIDVGCHSGVMLDEILKLSPNGIHYGFEPLPYLSSKLQEKYKNFENVKIVNSALSDVTGNVTFQHVVTNPGYSGLRQRRYDRPDEKIDQIMVKAERLDDVIPKNLSISFIKIDVEGAELQVLNGAIQLIKRTKPVIVFEHGLGAADYYDTKPDQVYNLLVNSCGLRCFTMDGWLSTGGESNLSRLDFAAEFNSGKSYYFLAAN